LAKPKKVFICTNCNAKSTRWEGKCVSCNQWNTLVEVIEKAETKVEKKRNPWSSMTRTQQSSILIQNVESLETARIKSSSKELDRVLGGGLVRGSLILLGGQPGIGKSTLLLQMALRFHESVLYVSGEESAAQIKMRADRIGIRNQDCFIFTETNLQKVFAEVKEKAPACVIVDSIQTLMSSDVDSLAGSVSQLKECAGEIQFFAKDHNIPFFIIGHITKEGSIAGPKLLEHVVDVLLHFEGDQNYSYRILRSLKNRFGSTDEIGIYEMLESGLREVTNPSELLIQQHDEKLSGSCIGAAIEGNQPLLVETQALVSTAVYGSPQRSTTGFDNRRLNMLLAVLEKRCGLVIANHDVFLNLAGGIKIQDPAMDLPTVSAILSSLHDIPVAQSICFAGEVGLSGEVRSVGRIEKRIQEAERLGFEKIFISAYNLKSLKQDFSIDIRPVKHVGDLFDDLFVV